MQMRFDGHIGFPGGLIEPGEEVVHGLIREMHEEINLDPESNQVISIKVMITCVPPCWVLAEQGSCDSCL